MVAVHGLRYTWNSQHYNHSTQSKSNTVIPWKTLNSKIIGHLCWKKWALFVVWKIKNIRKSGKIWSQKCRSLRKWTLLHGSQCPATIRINPKKFRVSVSPPCRLFLEPKKKKNVQSIQILQTVSMSSQRGAVGQSDWLQKYHLRWWLFYV